MHIMLIQKKQRTHIIEDIFDGLSDTFRQSASS